MSLGKPLLTVKLVVIVAVDPDDSELEERRHGSCGRTTEQVVCEELESNLESVSYVREVSVIPIERR